MNSYATEQLARHRYDQFVREAGGGHLMRKARSSSPLSQSSVGSSPPNRVGRLVWRLGGAVLAGILRPMRYRWGAKEWRIGEQGTGPHRA